VSVSSCGWACEGMVWWVVQKHGRPSGLVEGGWQWRVVWKCGGL
jgi:hypothetical protein